MTCASAGKLTVCRPSEPAARRFYRACWVRSCSPRVRAVHLSYGWSDRTILSCGHSAADGERWPLYQGPTHRAETREEVARWWRRKQLPSFRAQLKRLLETT